MRALYWRPFLKEPCTTEPRETHMPRRNAAPGKIIEFNPTAQYSPMNTAPRIMCY